MTGAAVLERTPDSTRGAVGTVTVVVPARNAARDLPRVLKPLRDAGWRIVVVDDHSTDATAEVAASMGATVMLSQGEANDYMARNTGALASDSEFLVFLDADVVAPAAVVRRALETVARGEAACVFGVYDRGDHLDGVVSRYKNFWIRVSTLDAPRPLTWINTSLAVMRRETYRAAGGFETTFTRGRGGGDLDFGRRRWPGTP